MDLKALDKALQEIAKRRNELLKVDYSNPKYDDLEEELHALEDGLQAKFGDYLEAALQQVHDIYCPDTDVLYPIAYIAKTYQISSKNEYSVSTSEGVFVEVDKYPGKDTKLVLVPSPPRVFLNIGKEKQELVWTAK
ncbi:MAG TPA: hypothetical protein VK517_18335 [Cyclobacteriaceae bacterium]|nr:hypothetical protein [Cyclobacteriaceae bacterium]